MRKEARGPSASWALVAVTVLFWVSTALMVVLTLLSWVAPGIREERSFDLLDGACVGLVMVTSGFLFWRELRTNRRASRAGRRETRGVLVEEDNDWTPMAWLYATAFGLSSFISLYLLPALFFSF